MKPQHWLALLGLALIGGFLLGRHGGPTDADLKRLERSADSANAVADSLARELAVAVTRYDSVKGSVQIVTKRVVVPVPGTPLPPETVYVAGDTTPHIVPGELPNRIRACEATLETCKLARLAAEAARDVEQGRANTATAWGKKQRGKGRIEGAVAGALVSLLALLVSGR